MASSWKATDAHRRFPPVWIAYGLGCALLTVLYLACSGEVLKTVLSGSVGLSSSVVTVIGVRRYRPRCAGAWYAMAAGLALFTAGDVSYWIQTAASGRDVFPSVSDALYLSSYPVLVAGLMALVRARRPGKDLPGLLDALTLSVGAAMLAWIFLMAPYLRDADSSTLARAVSLAYPAFDLLLLGVLLRLTTGRGDRSAAYRLIVAGMAAMLVGDIVYAPLVIEGAYGAGSILDVAWQAMYAACGAAALHPSMGRLSEPSRERPDTSLRPRRLLALGAASLMAPAILAIEGLRGMPIDVPVIVAGSTTLFLLVLARLHGLLVELSEAVKAVEIQATHDPLTGLANRRLFYATWDGVPAGAGESTSLLYVDLDGFKQVNDQLGHDAGDAVLVAVAERMRTVVRARDVIARMGGDEFAVMLPDTDGPRALAIAQRLVDVLSAPFPVGRHEARIGASVGLVAAAPGTDPADQLHRADQAMYRAKTAGRGCVRVA